MQKIEVKIDLRGNYISYLKKAIIKAGYHLNEKEKDDEICLKYHNVLLKRIEPKPRIVYVSKEFTCPSNVQAVYDDLKKKIESGEDLTPYLSRGVNNCDKEDGLLYDWGVYHLHLGQQTEADGFIKRTGPLLFVRFDESNAYLIGIYNHGDWYKEEIVSIIHRNWPETIKSYRLHAIALDKKYTDQERAQLRKAGVLTLVEPEPGFIYVPMGGGFTTAGSSLMLVKHCLDIFNTLRRYEEMIMQNKDEIVNQIYAQTGQKLDSLICELVIDQGKLLIIERQTGNFINFN